MTKLRYAPSVVTVVKNGVARRTKVHKYVSHRPHTHSGYSPIQDSLWALELCTDFGSVWHGFEVQPIIDGSLRMLVDVTGRENDEVLNKWDKA